MCRRFSTGGYHVFVAGHTAIKIEAAARAIVLVGGHAEPVETDATCERDVARLFDRAMAPGGELEPADLIAFTMSATIGVFDSANSALRRSNEFWRLSCFGGFLVGRESARGLAPLGRGTLIFTGASASLRGKPGFAHFAAAKAGLRVVAQSMAREFGPEGIHVAHVVIDCGIKGGATAQRQAAPSRTEARKARSAWTHEMDLRPYQESF